MYFCVADAFFLKLYIFRKKVRKRNGQRKHFFFGRTNLLKESTGFTLRYLYSGSPTAMAGLSFGYGIGLPLSRLHAKYLGGSLDLVSLPGYGVDVPWKHWGFRLVYFKRGMGDGCILWMLWML